MKPRAPSDLRILVADDNRDAAESLAKLISLSGFTVVGVEPDGQSALVAIRRELPDVAILDIGMPILNGYEVARAVKAELSPCPRLITLTGWGARYDRACAEAAGFDVHLTKPVQWADLEKLLLSWLDPASA